MPKCEKAAATTADLINLFNCSAYVRDDTLSTDSGKGLPGTDFSEVKDLSLRQTTKVYKGIIHFAGRN